MPDDQKVIGPEDLRSAVQAGVLSEAQAASLAALAADRAGRRAAMPAEDEPFEFFRGFSEIFVSVGLAILLAGVAALVTWMSGMAMLILVPAVTAAVSWWWADYFTLKRRMNLPSMLLATAFATGVWVSLMVMLTQSRLPDQTAVVAVAVLTMVALAAWYAQFRLPFTMFLFGLTGLAAVYGLTGNVGQILGLGLTFGRGIFDLRANSAFSLATLAFGAAAFAGAMWFDTRDPYRLGRHGATGFWLHMLAAPALVNTVALTLYNIGGSIGMTLTAGALALIAALALVIDRRSFLTAGIVYVGLVIAWVIRGGGEAGFGNWVAILLILGALITALGTWWVPLRNGLMRGLPDFPGKSRLPPYASLP